MSERFPSKSIILDNYKFDLHGVSDDDSYWREIQDNFEPEFQRFCRQLIQPEYVCLDLGANIGLKTLFLSRHCSKGSVVAVEANEDVYDCLTVNISENGIQNTTLIHAAIADHDGTIGFDGSSAWGHHSEDGVQIASISLATLVEKCQLPRLDFIKLDIEGMEFTVLRSAIETIRRFDSLVYLEFNALGLLVWGNTNPREFLEWITANFRYVYAVNRRDSSIELLEPVTSADQCEKFFRRNLADDGFVTDLVVSNSEYRFQPVIAFLEQQLLISISKFSQVSGERDAIAAERDAITAHRDAILAHSNANSGRLQVAIQSLQTERAAVLASASWHLTEPLRWLKRVLKPMRS